MAQSVDIDLLRRATVDSICVYEALRRAQTLTAESQHVIALAEDLLRQVGLAYLLNDVKVKADQPTGSPTSLKEIVSAYVQIQQSYADLKDALYQLAKVHIEAKSWAEALTVIEGLLKIDPQYRDIVTLLRQSLLDQAKDLFEQGQWVEGRAILKQRPSDKEMRLVYLSSFLDEDASMNGVRALQTVEPRVSKLPSFQHVVSSATTLSDTMNEYVSFPHRPYNEPSKPYLHSYTGSSLELKKKWDEEDRIVLTEYETKKREYDAKLREYDAEMRRYNAAQDRQFNAQYNFDDSLQDLRAELSSIISESK